MEEEEIDEPKKPGKQRRARWRKKRWRLLAILVVALIWLDGPGWRWIGEKAARHYVPGLSEQFELSGRLTGGKIGISNFSLGGMGEVELVGLDQASLNYKLGEIVSGRIRSLKLQGLHADIDLAKAKEKEGEEEPEKEETDLPRLLEDLRQRLVPMEIELREISARIHRGEEELFKIEPTTLTHKPGSSLFQLELGDMTILGDKEVGAQTSKLDWRDGSLSLSKLDVMPALGIQEFEMQVPIDLPMNFATGILIDGVRFNAESDLSSASLEKEEPALLVHQAADKLGFPIPAEATLETLKLEARNLSGGLETIEADLELSTSAIAFDGWTSSRLSLAARLEGDALKAVLKGEALGSPLDLDANAALDRPGGLMPEVIDLVLTIQKLDRSLIVVRDRFTPSDDPVAPPASSLKATAKLTFADGGPDVARADIAIESSETAPPINLEADWNNGGDANATVTIPGVAVSATFTSEIQSYSGKAELVQFAPESLEDWLAPFGVSLPPDMNSSLTWSGGGNLEENAHQGNLEISDFKWKEGPEAILASASASYAWPGKLDLTNLKVSHAEQLFEADLGLQDQMLELRKLSWTDGGDLLLNGTARIPVPEDLGDWKALLRETRPVEVNIESASLPLTKLHPYLPEDTRFRDDGRAELDIKLTGSMAKPVLDTRLVIEEIALLSQPDLPPLAVDLKAIGRDQTLKLEGDITGTDYPPVKIDAITNWDPKHWAEEPEVIKQAKLDASAKISDFNVNLLSKFVPDARKLEGLLNLDVEVSGTVSKPEPAGTIALSAGNFEMRDPSIPRLKDASLLIKANPSVVRLESLKAELSGGTLDASGSLELADGKPSKLDFRVKGVELPARRDENMIVRINTDLTLKGPWETARLAGKIEVVDSLFYKDIEILPIGVPFNQPAEPSALQFDSPVSDSPTSSIPAPFADWGLDLRLLAQDPFLIRGNLATGRAFLDVSVGGTIGDPKPSGKAQLFKVEAKLPFSSLSLTKGDIIFRPEAPFDPILNIRGESTIRPYTVNIYIYGPVSNPKILPTSNPPLPESEIMTLIATGTTTSGFEDPEAATARAAQLLIEEIRNGRVRYLNRLGPILKVIEKVDFQVGEKDPYTSTKYNSATINLSKNWLIRAGISEEGNTRTTAIYLFRFR